MDEYRYDHLLDPLRDYYDRDSARRGQSEEKVAWKIRVRQAFLDRLLAEKKQTLLEIGAGAGQDGLFFQENGLAVTCTDLSPEMVARCRSRGLKAEVKDFLGLDFPDSAFDAIYAMNCLLHVPDKDLPTVLTNIQRMLAPAGLFFFGTYGGNTEAQMFGRGPTEGSRFFAFRDNAHLKALVSPFFELVSFEHIPSEIINSDYLGFQNTVWRRPK